MNLIEAVESGLKNYFNFHGRAPRSEFWFFYLFLFLIGLLGEFIAYFTQASALPYIISVATFIPSLSVGCRRLHDINMSGWWQLLSITVVGIIPLFIWFVTAGDKSSNFYGSDPLDRKSTRSKVSMSPLSSYKKTSDIVSGRKTFKTEELYSDRSRPAKSIDRKSMPVGMSSYTSSKKTEAKTSKSSYEYVNKNTEMLNKGFKVVKKMKN